MARIDFAFGASDRLRMACQVVRKHYLAGRRLVVYTQDAQRLNKFDQLLWSFEPTAFVPHVMADDPLAAQTAVVLTSALPLSFADEHSTLPTWLVNLDMHCPPSIEAYDRVLEIVSGHDQDKLAARERWRNYQAEGHDLHAHDVSTRSSA